MVGLKDMAQSDAERAPPAWLRRMLATKFFEACPEHPTTEGPATRRREHSTSEEPAIRRRTTGCNFFCTSCNASGALCSGCRSSHEGHELIQIRRLTGHDAVKVKDIQHLLSVSLVQTYLCNGDPAVYLNKRGEGRHGASHCEECKRGIPDEDYRFCALGCKAEAIEDRPDFSVSFAANPNNDNPTDVIEADNVDEAEESSSPSDDEDEDSSSPSEFQN